VPDTSAPVQGALHEFQRFRLRGPVRGCERVFNLLADEVRVGRSRTNDVVLEVPGVSRHHATLRVADGALLVEDHSSKNGTYVGERSIRHARVLPGTKVRFGPVRFLLEPLEAEQASLAIEFRPGPSEEPTTSVETQHEIGVEDNLRRPTLHFPLEYCPGTAPAYAQLYAQMTRLLQGDLAVLIQGETGTGKEMIARTLHTSSARRRGPFLALNCAAIPKDLLESELFGIGRAVATGVEPRPGIFEQANGGTLLLDEIGEMPPDLQAKLLRVLQEREIRPLGGRTRKIDVWILSATNADLHQQMDTGQFRRDLYFRLAGTLLEVPPLRRCDGDIPRLVEHFLEAFCRQTGTPIQGLSSRALELLCKYPWPGNVRELAHEVRRLVHCASAGQILDSHLLSEGIRSAVAEGAVKHSGGETLALTRRLQRFEAELIREALRRSDGNQTHAARLLEVSRNGLLKKMKRLRISI
jgi:transcriptional regulator with PAS, ATPase and Fis domain